jgi:type II secretory ATPase GspE/PulE/Tfp pilus assembly ATPase PilB-like protein
MKARQHKYSYLIDNNLIQPKDLMGAISRSRKEGINVEDIFLKEHKINRDDVGKSLELFYNIPYFGFNPENTLPKHYFNGLNINYLRSNFWVPVQNDEKVVVLVNNPMDMDKIRNIKMTFPKKEVEFKVGLKVDIMDFLGAKTSSGAVEEEEEDEHDDPPQREESVSALLESIKSEQDDGVAVAEEEQEDDAFSDNDSSIVRLVNTIITDAYELGVSDIHIEPGTAKDNLLVRFRKDGECQIYEEIPPAYKQAMVSRIKIISKLDIAERRLPQDGKIKIKYGRKDIELRVATLPTVGGNEDVVMRILASNKPLPLDKMNFSPHNEKLIKTNVAKPYGLVLVVGPTGSGKTTTLHSALGYINTPKRKIWTAEDPVEITQKGLRQMQMHSKIGLDFARAMRSFLRGDPDVIMVGEMRDPETCGIGLEASLTGHLVLSTLHTNSAPETITRLIDMGMNPINFADALLLILAQRLVKTLCGKCKADYHPTKEEYDILVSEYGEKHFSERIGIAYSDDLLIKKPVGCVDCKNSGYAGRTGLHEALQGSLTIKKMIMQKATMEEIKVVAIDEGMSTLKQDGIFKIFKGDCDFKQVSAVCVV